MHSGTFVCPSCQATLPLATPSRGSDCLRCPNCGALLGPDPSPQTDAPPCLAPATINDALSGALHDATTVDHCSVSEWDGKRETPLLQIPGYHLLGELGRGGMGVVYKAYQLSLKRVVALKMIRGADSAGDEQLSRFRTEAEAVAHLQHPNIVQIYEIGEHQGSPYFSLEFVGGGSLTKKLKGGPLPQQQAARLVEILARAVQHAHQRGVIHRDLKPGNVLLMEDGTPKVTDFGLAKRLEGEDMAQTRSGAVLGTPSYMAPEQAEGKTTQIGPLVDVYALGALLYQMLTCKPPFRAETLMKTLHLVIHEEVVPPSRHQPKIDGDLETICLKALAKDPSQRYPSALALAQDLERYLAGEPILARRESWRRRLRRKLRRHRGAVLVTCLAVALGVTVAVTASVYLGLSTSRQVSSLNNQLDAGLDEANWPLEHRSRMEALIAELEQLDAEQGAEARRRLYERFARFIKEGGLRQLRLQPEDVPLIEADIAWLESRAPRLAAEVRGLLDTRRTAWITAFDLQAPFTDLAQVFSPGLVQVKGQHLTAAGGTGGSSVDLLIPTSVSSRGPVKLEAIFDESWEKAPEIGLALNVTQAHRGALLRLAFSSDGKLLCSAGADRTARVWEVSSGRELLALRDLPAGARAEQAAVICCLALSPNSRTLATGTENGRLTLWEVASGRKLASTVHPSIRALAFSADGKLLASGGSHQSARLWQADNLTPVAALADHPGDVVEIAFGPGPQRLTALTKQRDVVVWDLASQQVAKAWPLPSRADNAPCALTRDGQTVALASAAQTVLYDTATGKEKAVVRWGKVQPGRLAITDNGRGVAAVFGAHLRYLSLPRTETTEGDTVDERASVSTLAFAPSDGLLAVGLNSGNIVLWDVDHRKPTLRLGGTGYAFVLSSRSGNGALQAAGKSSRPPTLGEVRGAGAALTLRILRNGKVLRTAPIQLRPGPLHLLARREGGLLEFQINGGSSVVFHDIMPLPSLQGAVFGVHWPVQVRLSRLYAKGKTLPLVPSLLEKGDELFEKGQYHDALALYQDQLASAATPTIRQEVRCKAGLCLVHLNRLEEAIQTFGPVLGELDSPWLPVATCQLWLIYLQQKRLEEVEALVAAIGRRLDREQLLAYVPAQVRADILQQASYAPGDLVSFQSSQVRKGELALALAQLFQERRATLQCKYQLGRMYCMAGEERRGLVQFKECVAEQEASPVLVPVEMVMALRYATWLMCRQGEAAEALHLIDHFLFDEAGEVRRGPSPAGKETLQQETDRVLVFLSLYLERARAHAALRQWELAEQDLDTLRRLLPAGNPYYDFHASGLLMKGFLCERRGDREGARKVWKEGTYRSFLASRPEEIKASLPPLPIGDALLMHLMLSSLGEDLSDAEAQAIFQQTQVVLGGGSLVVYLAGIITIPPEVLREMWRSSRGNEIARQMAFHELPPRAYFRLPLCLCGMEKLKQDVLQNKVSAAQEQAFWDASVSVGEFLLEGKLNKSQMVQLALTYKGTTNFLGWGGLAPTLPPQFRGQVAYVMGHRFLRLNRAQDALMFFRTAARDAAADSALRGLAQAEVERLQIK